MNLINIIDYCFLISFLDRIKSSTSYKVLITIYLLFLIYIATFLVNYVLGDDYNRVFLVSAIAAWIKLLIIIVIILCNNSSESVFSKNN